LRRFSLKQCQRTLDLNSYLPGPLLKNICGTRFENAFCRV
jgi:hypothetical protein